MNIDDRIRSFSTLGEYLRDVAMEGHEQSNRETVSRIRDAMDRAAASNPWFTQQDLMYAIRAWGETLTEQHLTEWLNAYPRLGKTPAGKRVGVVMAGNIPLVGFHDFMSVLLAGHSVIARLSSQDESLLPLFSEFLCEHNPGWAERISFTSGKLTGFDAVIATGSNNTSRYFEYYFGKYPHIIRKSRTSAAILFGNETGAELEGLADDLFRYFGLGCRNVSKLFVPSGYDLSGLSDAFSGWEHLGNHHKFRNNYDYQKSIFLVNRTPFTDGGFFLLKEDARMASPVSVIFFERYSDPEQVYGTLEESAELLQCVVAKGQGGRGFLAPGKTQHPALWDYADRIDTMAFLTEKI